MSNSLCQTYLRQARSFLRVGDAARAIELLEKARALARDDKALLRNVTAALAEAYSAAGDHERASRCREQLQFLPAAVSVTENSDVGFSAQSVPAFPARHRRFVPRFAAATALLLLVGGGAFLVLRERGITKGPPTTDGSATIAIDQPGVPPPQIARGIPKPSSTTASLATEFDWGRLINRNVGLLLVICHYEGSADGRSIQIDLPVGGGSAFAVSGSGVLLTNRHVTRLSEDPSIPKTLQSWGMPTVTLRRTTYLACFGADSSDQVPAALLHESDQFDFAILASNRSFPAPLLLSSRPPHLAAQVYAAGFPEAVDNIFADKNMFNTQVDELIQQFRKTGKMVIGANFFGSESFKPTVTSGTISTPERNKDGVGYALFDAKVGHGNSGGPLLNSSGEVVGIVTLAGVGDANGYNLALLLDQLRDELLPYIGKQ